MSGEVELYADPSGLPYDDLVAAWGEVDSRSAWVKARLAAAVPRAKLERFAADVGVARQTVLNYRSVGKAYPPETTDVSSFPFGAAETLAGQQDRLELAGRAEPWTVREARLLVAERGRTAREIASGQPAVPDSGPAEDAVSDGPVPTEEVENNPQAGKTEPDEPASTEAKPPEAEPETAETVPEVVTKTAARPDPAPCPGCRDLEVKLKAAEEQITRLRASRPDAVLAAEKEFLADQNAALQAEVTRLKARLSDGPVRHDPGTAPQTQCQDADSAPCRRCEQPGAPVLVVMPDGAEDTAYACDACLEIARRKQPEVTFTRPEPVTSEAELDEMYGSFDYDEAITRS